LTILRQYLLDSRGNTVASGTSQATVAAGSLLTIERTLEVANPNLWHQDHPRLYTLRTVLCDDARGGEVVDEQIARIGIRHLRFDRDDGLFINGGKFYSLGCNRHQDHPYVGYALPDSAQWRDVKKL